MPGPYWCIRLTTRAWKNRLNRLPPKKDYHVYIARSTYHYAYARQTQVNWERRNKEKKRTSRKETKGRIIPGIDRYAVRTGIKYEVVREETIYKGLSTGIIEQYHLVAPGVTSDVASLVACPAEYRTSFNVAAGVDVLTVYHAARSYSAAVLILRGIHFRVMPYIRSTYPQPSDFVPLQNGFCSFRAQTD